MMPNSDRTAQRCGASGEGFADERTAVHPEQSLRDLDSGDLVGDLRSLIVHTIGMGALVGSGVVAALVMSALHRLIPWSVGAFVANVISVRCSSSVRRISTRPIRPFS